jgi:hypothetical protein
MASAETCAVVAVKILIEKDVVFPVWIFLKLLTTPIDRAFPACITKENTAESTSNLL